MNIQKDEKMLHSSKVVCMSIALIAILMPVSLLSAEPTKKQGLETIRKASDFMANEVAYRGGYVWAVAADLSEKWGEVPARPTQIWTQGGTPNIGHVFLDAYEATGESQYLLYAGNAANALIYGQHPLGGWHYVIDFDPSGIEEWYENEVSLYKWGYQEYRHYYSNCTYDDEATQGPTAFLLRLYLTTLDPKYRAPLLKALDFILLSQFPNGAWPQRYPLRYEFAHDGLADYTSYYTLNDGVAHNNINLLIDAYEKLGNPAYLEAAKRAVDFIIAVQGSEGQAAWAEQYNHDMRLEWARTHEPPGYVVRESRYCIRDLETMFLMTGDRRYLRPIPGCIAWSERLNREAHENNFARARYYEVGTNLPFYGTNTDQINEEGYGLYNWSHKSPPDSKVEDVVDVEPIKREYERLSKMTPAEARAEYVARRNAKPASQVDPDVVEKIIETLDSRGAWVTDVAVLDRTPGVMKSGQRHTVKGIETRTFVRNMNTLINYIKR